MRKTLKEIWIIARKDLIEFSRDRMRLFSFFIMPIFMMIMVGFIFPNENALKNAKIGLVNLDNGSRSKQFVKMLEVAKLESNEKMFKLKTYDSLESLKEGIRSHEINGGIFIDKDFSKKIDSFRQAELIVVEDQANPQASQTFTQALSRMVEIYSKRISAEKIAVQQRMPSETIKSIVEPVKVKIEGIVKGKRNYFEFVAPGIIAMIVMTAVLTGLAAAISREREIGTLDGILISPINRVAIVLGKALAQAVRGLVQGSIVLILASIVFGVKIAGSLILVLIILILGIFSFVGFGILVSASAAEQETATQLLFMFQFPMLFLSGVFFPISMMPVFMQYLSKAIPLTYAIEALRKVMVLGGGINSVKNEMLVLALFGIATTSISVPLFKKMITR
ncbi:MAG: ABC transporter permease [Actinobacteria bacterium]|nr:ABC transporter permease [Actinomycetota bacterium]